MTASPAISVIAPCASIRSVPTFLQSLRMQTLHPSRFEVIIVQDPRADVRPLLSRFKLGIAITVLDLDPRWVGAIAHTAGVARNQAAALARGAILAFIDADCALSPECLERHVALVGTSERRVICGAAPELPFPAQDCLVAGHYDQFDDLARRVGADYRERFAARTSAADNDWELFYTCNASLPRALFAQSGGFDRSGYRCHDMELGYRLKRLGAQFVFSREPFAIHIEHPRSLEYRAEQAKGWHQLADTYPEIAAVCDDRVTWLKHSYARSLRDAEAAFTALIDGLPGFRTRRTFVMPLGADVAPLVRRLASVPHLVEEMEGGRRWRLRFDRNCWDYSIICADEGALDPLVTVLMPVHNAGGTVRRALESVFTQDVQRFQIVIVDDDSTDDTAVECDDFASDPRVVLYRRGENGGMSRALNDGLQMASADLILHLDADDWLEPDCISEVIRALASAGDAAAAYGRPYLHEPNGAVSISQGPAVEDPISFLEYRAVQAPRVYRRQTLVEIGGWSIDDGNAGRYFEDRVTLSRIAQRARVLAITKPLYHVAVHRGTLSRRSPMTTAAAKLAILWQQANRQRADLEYTYERAVLRGQFRARPRDLVTSETWSVVIPARDHADLLALSLESWLQIDGADRVELIVVDDGSAAPLAATLERFADRVRFVRNDYARGPAYARNLGATNAGGTFVMFSDADHIVPRDVLALHERRHRRAEGRALVVGNVVGRRTYSFADAALPVARKRALLELMMFSDRFDDVASALAAGRTLPLLARDGRGIYEVAADLAVTDRWLNAWSAIIIAFGEDLGAYPHAWTRVSSGSLSVRRSDLLDLGGFDASLLSMEDWELGARAQKAGLKIVCAPEAEPLHQIHVVADDREERDAAGARRLVEKHPDLVRFLTNPASPVPSPAQGVIADCLTRTPDRGPQPVVNEGLPFAVTFDDGPSPASTEQLLAALARAGLRATFFLLGSAIEGNEGLVHDIVERGHELGVHGWHHTRFDTLTYLEVRDQLRRAHDTITRASGTSPRWIRPPYGLVTAATMKVSAELGLEYAGWTVSSEDWRNAPLRRQITEVAAHGLSGAIILCHDGSSAPDTVSELLAWVGTTARSHGLWSATMSELARYRKLPAPVISKVPTWVTRG